MRVALDATSLLGPRTGIGTFTYEVATRLAEREDVDLTVFAITWRGRGALAGAVPAGVHVVGSPLPARPLRFAWRHGLPVRTDRWTGPQDIVHGPNFVVPPTRAAQIVTVHDLTCVRFPELCTRDTLEYPLLLRHAVSRGAWIHTVSRAVADEVIELLRVPAERVRAIPNGIGPPPPSRPSGGTGPAMTAAPGRYILGLGTIEPRKDFPTLVEAFDRLAADDPELRLVIAGPDGWGLEAFEAACARAAHRDRIKRLGWVDASTRTELLRGAAVLAYPSRYEGFGLPVLEAQQIGIPVVTTEVPALVETAGQGAHFVPVGDAESLARALHLVLHEPDTTEALVAAGLANAARFSWDLTVDGLVSLYHEVRAAHRG